ncbi:uncharacterized protein LOC123723016 [Papilio machaon]|uniref:uncharacterized protein LOC123723016 n=1 Tax=Papilio machaon TaxID=76193 RepID=UPI001E662BCD|nr:uncharacterized protein LOC123723016 [Papilio machaon]
MCNIVINEVLAYIQNKIDVMDEESLVRLCTTSFSVEEIESAKCLLFEAVSTTKRNVTRRKAGKQQRDLYDVITLFKETDPEQVPTFVAKELHRLPPITFDHVDASRLLKDILIIQNEIKNIKHNFVTESQFGELRNEINNLKKITNENIFDKHVNRKRGVRRIIDSCGLDSGPIGLLHTDVNTTPISTANKDSTNIKNILESTCHSSPSCLEGTHDAISACAQPIACACDNDEITSAIRTCEKKTKDVQHSKSTISVWPKSKTMAEVLKSDEGEWEKKNTIDQDWVTVQKRRSKNKFIGRKGKAQIQPESNFKVANIHIPLFINKVDKATTEKDISDYILQKTDISVSVKKINMVRQKRYDAYKIFVPHNKLSVFLNDDLWPEGIQFRRFVFLNRTTYDQRQNTKHDVNSNSKAYDGQHKE